MPKRDLNETFERTLADLAKRAPVGEMIANLEDIAEFVGDDTEDAVTCKACIEYLLVHTVLMAERNARGRDLNEIEWNEPKTWTN